MHRVGRHSNSHKDNSLLMAWVHRQAGMYWSQWFLTQSRKMSSHVFYKRCLPTCRITWQNLSVLGRSTPCQLLSKTMLSSSSPEGKTCATLGAHRHFSRLTTSSRTSEAGTRQPRNWAPYWHDLKSQGPSMRIRNAWQPVIRYCRLKLLISQFVNNFKIIRSDSLASCIRPYGRQRSPRPSLI